MKMILVLIVAIVLPLTTSAAEVILNPVADAPIWAGSPNENYGSAIDGYWGYYNGAQRTLVRWNVSGIYGTVTACKLRFHVWQNNWVNSNMIMACRVTASWAEYAVTYNTQPNHDTSFPTGVFMEEIPPSGTGVFTYDCGSIAPSIVQNWISNSSANHGVILRTAWEGTGGGAAFPYMRESPYTPVQLIVTYTPGGSGVAPASLGRVKATFK
jgi:hypothetical protein